MITIVQLTEKIIMNISCVFIVFIGEEGSDQNGEV